MISGLHTFLLNIIFCGRFFMALVEEFITDTNAAGSSHDVFAVFEKAMRSFGYDRICYSLITDHPSLGLKAGHGVLRNYPNDWMKHYVSNGYVEADPVPQFCFVTNRPFTWEHVTNLQYLTARQLLVMNEAREANLLDGIAVPIHGIQGELSGVGLASSSGGIDTDKETLHLIRAIVMQFHLAYTEKESSENFRYSKNLLTKREAEILSWAAEGKSDTDISDILGISYPTVRFHLNNAYKKLGANERIFAVTKAIRHGLILPSYIKNPPIEVAS